MVHLQQRNPGQRVHRHDSSTSQDRQSSKPGEIKRAVRLLLDHAEYSQSHEHDEDDPGKKSLHVMTRLLTKLTRCMPNWIIKPSAIIPHAIYGIRRLGFFIT